MNRTPYMEHCPQSQREELVARLLRAIAADGRIEALPGLYLRRESAPTECAPSLSSPAFCMIAQGRKNVFLGDECYPYDPLHYLLATAEMPITSHIIEASSEQPFLSVCVALEPLLVSAVMLEVGYKPGRSRAEVRAMNVSPLSAELLDAVIRLVRLLDAPDEAPFLLPLIQREIIYRLLKGEQGDRLRYLIQQEEHSHRIVRVIHRLRQAFDQPLQVEAIAQELGMSVSSFYHHFRAVTAMSPLQFQKQIRLQEARRLMLAEGLDATSAAFRVGYNDASHFNREYKRFFGRPPLHDVERLRETTAYTMEI